MRNVSFSQALVTLACFAAIGFAHYLGPSEGTIVAAAVAYLCWLREPPSGPSPPAIKAAMALVAGLCLGHVVTACETWTAPNVSTLRVGERKIDRCEQEAIDAPDGGHFAAWDACKQDAGLP